MKNKLFLSFAVIILILSILACNVTINTGGGNQTIRGSGISAVEDRLIKNISGVELTMPGTLYITMGSGESLRIEADDNLIENIETDVRGDTLVIRTRQGYNVSPKTPIKYYLTVDELSKISNTSSGDIEVGDLAADSLSVNISSSGSITIASLDSQMLKVHISSSGGVEVKGGQVQQQTIDISSSGGYKAKDLESSEANVSISSSGDATIKVSDELNGRISSSGNIYYVGSPQVKVSTSSSGKAVQVSK